MNALALVDNNTDAEDRRWTLTVQTERIPREAFSDLKQADALVEQANALWHQAQSEADALKRRNTEAGRDEGRAQALAETAGALAGAQTQAHQFIAAEDDRILSVAAELVRRILPELGRETVLDELLRQALTTIHAERRITIRVHPDCVESVRQRLPAQLPNASGCPISVQGDLHVDPFDCRVDSDLGRLEAGFHTQLASLLDQLTPGERAP